MWWHTLCNWKFHTSHIEILNCATLTFRWLDPCHSRAQIGLCFFYLDSHNPLWSPLLVVSRWNFRKWQKVNIFLFCRDFFWWGLFLPLTKKVWRNLHFQKTVKTIIMRDHIRKIDDLFENANGNIKHLCQLKTPSINQPINESNKQTNKQTNKQ